MELESNNHSVFLMHYHLVLVVKYRRRVITDAVSDCVCVEDLDMRGMSRSLKLGKSTMDNGFGMFRALLGYKLEDRGKRLVTVGRLFPSSQLCHECGYRFSGTKDLSVREWTCPLCGRTHDRDVNAARNIRDEGMRLALSA